MSRLILVMGTLLVACAPIGKDDPTQNRRAKDPIYSSAAFDLGRLDGKWYQVAVFGAPDCNGGEAAFASDAGTHSVAYNLCLSNRAITGRGQITPTGPGRFSVTGVPAADQDWWVLWVDESYRTLAIGTPSGAFGFILNRDAALPEDRLKAARDVFDFNGYNIENLHVFEK